MFVLHVIDASRPDSQSGAAVVSEAGHSRINKCDLPNQLKSMPPEAIRIFSFARRRHPRTARANHHGDRMTPNAKSKVISLLMNASRCVASGYKLSGGGNAQVDGDASVELISQELRVALDTIGEITGKTTTEDLLDSIFSSFASASDRMFEYPKHYECNRRRRRPRWNRSRAGSGAHGQRDVAFDGPTSTPLARCPVTRQSAGLPRAIWHGKLTHSAARWASTPIRPGSSFGC